LNRAEFDDYVRYFNAEDPRGFEKYLSEDVHVQNGRMRFQGLANMKAHYAKIWGKMKETLNVRKFISSSDHIAVDLWTHFDVLIDDEHSIFGPVRKGEAFDYTGIVFYTLSAGKIIDIKVSYLDFEHTALDGTKTSLGIVH